MRELRWSKKTTALIIVLWVLVTSALVTGGYLSGIGAGDANEPISANATLRFEDDRYYPSNETVVTESGLEVPFERYTWWYCGDIASWEIRDLLRSRYGYEHSWVSTGQSHEGVQVDALLYPFAEPGYYELERTLPREVHVTLQYENGTRTCTVPVHVNGQLSAPKLHGETD